MDEPEPPADAADKLPTPEESAAYQRGWDEATAHGLRSQFSEEEIYWAAAKVRDRELAKFVTFALALACERHAEEVKAALGGVFDLSEWEKVARTIDSKFGAILHTQQVWRDRFYDLEAVVKEQGRQTKELTETIDNIRGAWAKLQWWAKAVSRRLKLRLRSEPTQPRAARAANRPKKPGPDPGRNRADPQARQAPAGEAPVAPGDGDSSAGGSPTPGPA